MAFDDPAEPFCCCVMTNAPGVQEVRVALRATLISVAHFGSSS
jgi:hypothetical protein